MILTNSITIDFPVITKSDGTNITRPPIILDELNIVLSDSPKHKVAQVKIYPFPYPLNLWSGSDYDMAGDYTQAQIENKIIEYMGNNPKSQLEKLFLPPNKR